MGKILFLLHSRRSQISGSGETCLSPCGFLVEWPGFKPRTKKLQRPGHFCSREQTVLDALEKIYLAQARDCVCPSSPGNGIDRLLPLPLRLSLPLLLPHTYFFQRIGTYSYGWRLSILKPVGHSGSPETYSPLGNIILALKAFNQLDEAHLPYQG